MDPQGNATSSVGVDPRNLPSTLYRTLIGLDTPDPIPLNETVKNVSLLPSSMDLAATEIEFHHLENREWRLKTVLDTLDSHFQYIIIDSPPSLNMLSVNSLVAAHYVLVPVQAEFMALEGLAHVMHTLDLIRNSFNPNLELLGLVVTMFDARTRLSLEVVHELNKAFDKKVFQSKIVRSVRLSEAPSFGKPIIYYEPRSPGALAYLGLTQEIINVCKEAGFGPRIGRAVQAAEPATEPAAVPSDPITAESGHQQLDPPDSDRECPAESVSAQN
jgi:chromosome partitioning protein